MACCAVKRASIESDRRIDLSQRVVSSRVTCCEWLKVSAPLWSLRSSIWVVSGITGVQGKHSSYVGGGRVLDGEIIEIFWVATKIFVF